MCCLNVLWDKIFDCGFFGYFFRFDMEIFVCFILIVRKGYCGVVYYNWGYVFVVVYSMCVFMKMVFEVFIWEEVFVYLFILFCNYVFCGGLY